MKKAVFGVFSKLLCSLLALCLLTGLGVPAFAEENVTLWLVTEETVSDGMNAVAENLIDAYEKEHKNLTIRMDILPASEKERAACLSDLRQKIAQGQGPDLYLLPTSNVLITDRNTGFTYQKIEPLFGDVRLSMEDGTFLDIGEFYDKDTDLQKEELNTQVMDAGKLGKARYVLPLRFDFPVYYAFPQDWQKAGMDIRILREDLEGVMTYLTNQGKPEFACGAEYWSLDAFSEIYDYQDREVELEAEDVREYLEQFQKLETVIGTEVRHRTKLSLANAKKVQGMDGELFPLHNASLNRSLDYLAMATVLEKPMELYPLRSEDGDVIATVTYFGAVGADCRNPETAYDFLRQFLLADSQWEKNRKGTPEEQNPGIVAAGWPVRTRGSVEALWENRKQQDMSRDFVSARNLEFTDKDLPILQEKIDEVRFPIAEDLWAAMEPLNDYEKGNAPTDADLSKIASDFVAQLHQRYS